MYRKHNTELAPVTRRGFRPPRVAIVDRNGTVRWWAPRPFRGGAK